MTNQKPINHHYVPRLYLKGFVDGDGKLHVFDRYSKRYRYSAPKGVAYSPDYLHRGYHRREGQPGR
jgi:hypothetical protein